MGVCERVTEKRICVCDPSTLRLHYHTAHCSGPRFVLQSHAPLPAQASPAYHLAFTGTPPHRFVVETGRCCSSFCFVLYCTVHGVTVPCLCLPRDAKGRTRDVTTLLSPISAATCTLGTLPESSKTSPSKSLLLHQPS